jgi:hypothetical protein
MARLILDLTDGAATSITPVSDTCARGSGDRFAPRETTSGRDGGLRLSPFASALYEAVHEAVHAGEIAPDVASDRQLQADVFVTLDAELARRVDGSCPRRRSTHCERPSCSSGLGSQDE